MSLYKRNNAGFLRFLGRLSGRGTALALMLGVLLVALSACGFRPLYGKTGGQPAALGLAATDIAPIEDRIGQQLRNNLFDLMNPRGRPADPRYRLGVSLSTSVANTGLSKSADATRAELHATARFTLTELASGKTLFSAERRLITGYDILDSEYATLVSEREARARTASELALMIQNQLGAFFLKNAQGAAQP